MGFGTTDAATTGYQYDNNGNLTQLTDGRQKLWKYEYDYRNRKTKATDPNLNYTSWTYDGAGKEKTEKRSSDLQPIQYTYDDSNHLTDTTDQAGNHTHMDRDGAGNMLSLTDPKQHTYTFTYDGMNRKLTMSYPGNGSDKEQWAYDDAGNLGTYITRAGQVETFGYDERNRETSTGWSDSTPGTAKTYFDHGLLHTLNSSVSSLTYAYDDANRLTSEIEQINADSGPKTVSYTYDSDDNRHTIGYPSGSSATLDYSNRNQLKAVTATSGITAAYTYDGNGNPLSKTLGNGTAASYTYDDASRLTHLDHQRNGTSFAKYDYGYNPSNTRASRAETISAVTKTDAYLYDPIDQITQARYNATTNTEDRNVVYDYDPAGNRNYVADGPNISGYNVNSLNQYTNAGGLTPIYDLNGNMTGQDGWGYTYDALNRMTSAYSASATITFAYDGRNRCVQRTVTQGGTPSTMFLYYDGWSLIEEQDASSIILARYVNGAKIDEIVARVAGTSTSYYQADALGSTAALTDSSGDVIERYTYDVFGAPNPSTSSSGNRFLFTGREYIQPVALYDYRNRVYSPWLGRFLQSDRLRFRGGDVNLYRYSLNNSTNLVDPSGDLAEVPWVCTANCTCVCPAAEGKKCLRTGSGVGSQVLELAGAKNSAINVAQASCGKNCVAHYNDCTFDCHQEGHIGF